MVYCWWPYWNGCSHAHNLVWLRTCCSHWRCSLSSSLIVIAQDINTHRPEWDLTYDHLWYPFHFCLFYLRSSEIRHLSFTLSKFLIQRVPIWCLCCKINPQHVTILEFGAGRFPTWNLTRDTVDLKWYSHWLISIWIFYNYCMAFVGWLYQKKLWRLVTSSPFIWHYMGHNRCWFKWLTCKHWWNIYM